MIGVTPPTSDAALHVIEGGLSTSYLTQYARAHDEAALISHWSATARRPLKASWSRFMPPRTRRSSAISSRIGRDLLHRR